MSDSLQRSEVFAEKLTDFDENYYIGYPHTRGFADDGETLILGRLDDSIASLWRFSPSTKEAWMLCEFAKEAQPEKLLWFDLGDKSEAIVVAANGAIFEVSFQTQPKQRCVFRPPAGTDLSPIPGVSHNGARIVTGFRTDDTSVMLEIDSATGKSRELGRFDWYAAHFQFCPYDENWIGFAHEGTTELISDRLWAWHERISPSGNCLFDQRISDPSGQLYAGHERWSFHDRSAFIVVYGVSPGTPRGIYEVFADDRPSRLVSQGDRDFHVNVSRDGQWVVVDTTGPHDRAGEGWKDADMISDILLVEPLTGRRHFLARSRAASHPSHPHPVFSPAGDWIYFNECDVSGQRNRVWRIQNPLWKA